MSDTIEQDEILTPYEREAQHIQAHSAEAEDKGYDVPVIQAERVSLRDKDNEIAALQQSIQQHMNQVHILSEKVRTLKTECRALGYPIAERATYHCSCAQAFSLYDNVTSHLEANPNHVYMYKMIGNVMVDRRSSMPSRSAQESKASKPRISVMDLDIEEED